MIKNIFSQLFILLLLFAAQSSFSQIPEETLHTKVSVNSNKLTIGDHINLKLTVENPGKAFIYFPSFNDNSEISKNVDFIKSGIDTIFNDQKEISSIEQTLIITSFTEGQHEINNLVVKYQYPNDTTIHQSLVSPLFINVLGVVVDTTKSIKDIKGIQKEAITFKEILPYLLIALAAILIPLLTFYFMKRYSQNKPFMPFSIKPSLPAHVVALRELEALRLKKLWQNDRTKEYYTELTDILRLYITTRFNISATEMTSDEIIDSLNGNEELNSNIISSMHNTFQTADLVKFAKSNPLPDKHDACFRTAVNFVEQTVPHVETDSTSAMQQKKVEQKDIN